MDQLAFIVPLVMLVFSLVFYVAFYPKADKIISFLCLDIELYGYSKEELEELNDKSGGDLLKIIHKKNAFYTLMALCVSILVYLGDYTWFVKLLISNGVALFILSLLLFKLKKILDAYKQRYE